MGVAVLAMFLVEVRAGGAVDAPIALVFAAVVLVGTGLLAMALAPTRRGPLVAPAAP